MAEHTKRFRDRLFAYHQGDLPPAEQTEMQQHLETCTQCQRQLRLWELEESQLRAALIQPKPSLQRLAQIRLNSRRALHRRNRMKQIREGGLKLAGALILLLVLSGTYLYFQQAGELAQEPTLQQAQATAEAVAANPDAQNQTVVRLAVNEGEIRQFESLLEPFKAENPDIYVQLVGQNALLEEGGPRLLAESADIFPSTAQRDYNPAYTLDLAPLIEQDPSFHADDFYPNLLVKDGDKTILVPTAAAYSLIYYNQALFDEAGIAYPENGWTLDDFLQTAQRMTEWEGETMTQIGYVPSLLNWSPLLANQLAAPIGKPGGARFDGDDLAAALNWLEALFNEHKAALWDDFYGDTSTGSMAAMIARIEAGDAAMWERTIGSYEQHVGAVERLGVVAAPVRADGQVPAEPIIVGYALSAGTQNPEAAWRVVSYLSRQPPIGGQMTYFVPARRSVAESSGYWEKLEEGAREAVHYTAENNAQPLLWTHTLELQEAFRRVVVDGEAAELVLAGREPEVVVAEEPVVVATAEPAAEAVTGITFFSTFNGMDRIFRELAREFMRQNPTINVEVADYFNNQIDPFSPGYTEPRTLYQGANCFLHKTQGSDAGELREFVIPITPLMEIDPEMSADDYFPAALTPFTDDGVLYAVPATSFPSVIIYDRDRFVEFDVAEPPLEWTLDDFLETARRLTNVNADGEQVYGFAALYFDTPGNPLVQFGIPLIDNSVSPPTLNLRNAERAYRWYTDLIRVHQVQPLLTPATFGASLSGFDANSREFFQLMDNAQIAMWPARHMNRGPEIADTPEFMTRIPEGQALERANLVLMPLPVGPSGYSGSAPGAAGYFIAAASSPQQRDACWQWIKYLTRQRAAAEGVPTRIDVFESDAYREEVGQRAHDVFRLALESAHVPQNSRYDLPEWMGFGTSPLQTVYQQVAAGEADLLEELDRLQVRFDEYRSCLIERDAFLTDDFHEVDPLIRYECAMLVDPERGQLLRPKDLTQ